MGMFIRVSVDEDQISPELARSLVGLCPVDIFTMAGEQLRVDSDQEDECTLCELCLKAAPQGAIVIHTLYLHESLVSNGAQNESSA